MIRQLARWPEMAGLTLCLGMALLAACNAPAAATPTPQNSPTVEPTAAPTSTHRPQPPEGALISPDGSRYAVVQNGARLVAGTSDGTEIEIAISTEITDLTWFPDSRHLLYVDRGPDDTDRAQGHARLWIVDVEQAAPDEIALGFAPRLSPNGRHIAFIHGTRSGDACVGDFGLGVVEMDESFRPATLIPQSQIQGIPTTDEPHTFLPDLPPDRSFPGRWLDDNALEVAMRWACRDQFDQDGIYRIEVDSSEAEKVAGLGPTNGSAALETYVSSDGGYSIRYPADQFILRIGERPSVDGVIIPSPDSASLHKLGEPSLLITIWHLALEEDYDLPGLVAAEDPCAAGSASAESRTLGQLEAILLRDTPCGPYGYSLIAAIENGTGYLIRIEAHVPFEELAAVVDPVLDSFETLE